MIDNYNAFVTIAPDAGPVAHAGPLIGTAGIPLHPGGATAYRRLHG